MLHISFTYCITLSKTRYLGSKITKFKTQKFVLLLMCIGVTDVNEIKRLNKKTAQQKRRYMYHFDIRHQDNQERKLQVFHFL